MSPANAPALDGQGGGEPFPPGDGGGRTTLRLDAWDSLISQCPGGPCGVTSGTQRRVWGAGSQDPGAPSLALLPGIAAAPAPRAGGLGRGGRQAAPRVSQLCFLPLPPLWLLNQSPGTLASQLVPIHRLSHQTVSRQIFTQHLPERSQGRDGILRKAEDSAVLESGVASHTGSHSHSTHTHQHTTHTLNTHTRHPTPWFKPTFSIGASASPSVGGAQSTQLL